MNPKYRLKKSNITFIIFTYNEERRIEYPIKCYLPYGDVLISDDSSTDNTVKIAKYLGAKIIKRKVHGAPFVENKEESDYIFGQVKTDWVFWGFADEIVPKTCLDLFDKISRENRYKVVVQKRKTLMYDSKSEFYPAFGSVEIKFFKKDALDYTDNTIHQSGKFAPYVKQDEILYLPPIDEYSVYHFQIFTTDTQLNTIKSYHSAHAQTVSKNISAGKIIFKPFVIFFTVYFFQGAWKRGITGFIAAMWAMFYNFIMLTKAWELKKGITRVSMEENYKKAKKKLLVFSPKSNVWQKIWAYIIGFIVSRLHKWHKFRR